MLVSAAFEGRMGRALKLASLLVWVGLSISSSFASPIIGPPVQTKDIAAWWPTVSYNPTSDRYLVIWGDYAGGVHLKGRLANPNTGDLGPVFPVSSWSGPGTGYTYVEGGVAYNPDNGEWFVLFGVEPVDNDGDIYAQRIDANGNQIGSYIPIATGSGATSQAHVAYSPAYDRYLVVWTYWSDPRKVHGRLFDLSGSPIGSQINITDNSPYSKMEPRVDFNPVTNEFLVVWSDQRNWNGQGNDNDWVDVYAQRINAATGALVGGNVMVCGPTGTPYVGDGLDLGEIIANPVDGRYFLAVTRLSPVVGAWVTHGRILNSDATPYTSLFNVSYPQRGGFTGVVRNPIDNTYITTYLDANYDLSGKQFSATGVQIGSVIPVFRTPLYEENFGFLAIRPSDGQMMQVTVWFENLVTHARPSFLMTQKFKLGADTQPPIGPISLRAFKQTPTSVKLTWTNPRDQDLSVTIIRRRGDTYPTSVSDGVQVCNRAATPGASDSYMDTIGAGETRYYSLFCADQTTPTPNYSAAVHAVASDVWLNETFDNYGLGYLDMQGGWTRSDVNTSACEVQDATRVGASGKAVEILANSGLADHAGLADFGSITGGYHRISFDMRRNASFTTNQAILEVFGSGMKICRVYWGEKYRILTGPGDMLTDIVVSPVSNQWYHVELGLDLDARTLDAWVDNVRKVTAAPFWQSTGNIDVVALQGYSSGTLASYLDNLKGERVPPDSTPPSPVTNFTTTSGVGQVNLSWTNPGDSDFAGTLIRYKTGAYPTSSSDGTFLCNRWTPPGAPDSYIHGGLGNDVYFYTAFAYDEIPNYSVPAYTTGTPGCVAVWLNETFENYNYGNLGGQGSWTTTGSCSAQVAYVASHPKAVTMDAVACGGSVGNRISFGSKNGGYHYVKLDVCQDATGTTGQLIGYVSFQASDSTEIAKLLIQKSRLLMEYGSGSQAILTLSATNGTWYAVKIGFDVDARNFDLWLDGNPKGADYAWKGSGTNLAAVVIASDRNLNLNPQKAHIDNLTGEVKPVAVTGLADDGAWTPSLSKLHFSFNPAQCAGEYQYAIGTAPGVTNVRSWTSCQQATNVTATDLTLVDNQNYYVSVRAGTGIGTWGDGTNTNGIKVAPGVGIQEAKGLADGGTNDVKSIRRKTVTAVLPGYFYVQQPDKPFGIKILSSATPQPGDEIDVCGVMCGAGAERYLDATGKPSFIGPGIIPGPMSLSAVSLGGSTLNAYTPGVSAGLGPNNIGLLVKAYGSVTQRQTSVPKYFYIDDGCGLKDGSSTGGAENVGVRIDADPADYPEGAYVAVTGIISCFNSSGLRPIVLPVEITILSP